MHKTALLQFVHVLYYFNLCNLYKGRCLMKCQLRIFMIKTYNTFMKTPIDAITVLLVLGAAVYFDLTREKVPNRLIITGYIAGAIFNIHAPPDIIHYLISIIWPILLLYPLFLIRGLGAGDIKLFSVLSIFTSSAVLIQVMILSLFVGTGVFALRWLACSCRTGKQPPAYIHYTLAILAAYVITLQFPDILSQTCMIFAQL